MMKKCFAVLLAMLAVLCCAVGIAESTLTEELTAASQKADAMFVKVSKKGRVSNALYAPEKYYVFGTNVYIEMPSGMVQEGTDSSNGVSYVYWSGSGYNDNVDLVTFCRFRTYATLDDWQEAMSVLNYTRVNVKTLEKLRLVYGLKTTDSGAYQLQFVFNRSGASYGISVENVSYDEVLKFINLVNTMSVTNDSKIHVNADSLLLYPGQTYELVTSQEGENALYSYTSSKTSVMTVDANGKVTAVGKGTAYVRIKSSNGASLSVRVKVQATPKIKAKDTTVSLGDRFTIDHSINTSAKATYNVVKWKVRVTNTNVVYYNEQTQVFTALSRGTTSVTFTNNFGSTAKTIRVTVK